MPPRTINRPLLALALATVMAAPGIARAQFSLDDMPCFPYPPTGDFGLGAISGLDAGFSPYGLGSFGVSGYYGGYGGSGGFGAPPWGGHGWGLGQGAPMTSSFPSRTDVLNGIPDRRVRRRRPRLAEPAPRSVVGSTRRVETPKPERKGLATGPASSVKIRASSNPSKP